jgi:hypothetical protein
MLGITLFRLNSVGYHSELRIVVTIFADNISYQLSYIIFLGVHTNY